MMLATRWRTLSNSANVLLLMLKVLNVYSHWAINDDFERIAPSLVFLLLLTCRLVVDWQIVRSERSEKEKVAAGEESGKSANSETVPDEDDTTADESEDK